MAKRPPPRASFRTLPSPPDNPVQVAELAYLDRSRRRGSARLLFWLLLVALGVSVGLSGALYLMGRSGNVGGVELLMRYQTFRGYFDFANVILSILILTTGPVLMLETLLLGSVGVARELRATTWDSLVLTNLTAWQIVTGKWRAVQAYLYRHYGGIMVLRAVAFLWTVLAVSLTDRFDAPPDILAGAFAVFVAVMLLALNLGVAGASSLLASFMPGPMASFGGAVALHLVTVLLLLTVNVVVLRPIANLVSDYATEATVVMAIMPFDSGMIAASQFLVTFRPEQTITLAVFALLNVALLAGLTGGLLVLARRLAMRRGAAA